MFILILFLAIALVLCLFFALRLWCSARRSGNDKLTTIAFFHPYCNAGGGGERVLWCAVRDLQERFGNSVHCVVYTGDIDSSSVEILTKAKQRFNINIPHDSVEFIYLRYRRVVEADLYPHFTLLGQTFGGFLLACEALWRCVPQVFVDSMGYPASLRLFRLIGGCRVACYVHYPTISTDMIEKVSSRQMDYNNPSLVSRNPVLTWAKLTYYRLFAWIYGLLGGGAQVVMVNSTWTYNHIVKLWGHKERVSIIYPPCEINGFMENTAENRLKELEDCRMVTIGQFRPEKNHVLLLNALRAIVDRVGSEAEVRGFDRNIHLRLVFIGSIRHDEDKRRLERLQMQAIEMGLAKHVEWQINASLETLKEECKIALIGLHAMWNEHFGIGIVENMAAGNIVIAHNSGGPKMDIVRDFEGEQTGFLAATPDEYANAIMDVLSMSAEGRDMMRRTARRRIEEFSQDLFMERFVDCLSSVM